MTNTLTFEEEQLLNTPDSELYDGGKIQKYKLMQRMRERENVFEDKNTAKPTRKGRSKAERDEALRKSYEQQRRIVENMSPERQKYLKDKHSQYANVLEQLEIGDKLISVDGDIIGEIVEKQNGNVTVVGENITEVILNDTFTDDGVVSFLDMGGYFDISIADQIRAHQNELNNMDVVASINTNKEFESKQDVISWALEKLKHLGGKVFHKDFGDIVIDKKRLKNGYNYLKSYEEYVAYSLIGDVIEKGLHTKVRPKHKQRNYDTVTFFAPVEMNGVRGNMAVTLRIDDGVYYKVHQVLLPNGKRFNPIEKGDIAGPAGLVQNELDLSPTDNISKDMLPQNEDIVKTNSTDTDLEITDNDMYAKDKVFWQALNKNEEAVVPKTLKDKISGLFGEKKSDNTPSIDEIVKDIETEFGLPITTGKFRQKAYGIYKNFTEAIRTKVKNALPTIAHELGHHVDNRHKLRQYESIDEAMRVLKETRPDFYNAYKPEARPKEAVAEFMRDYLADRTLAKEKYPFFYEEFRRKMAETDEGKKDLENLDKTICL